MGGVLYETWSWVCQHCDEPSSQGLARLGSGEARSRLFNGGKCSSTQNTACGDGLTLGFEVRTVT
jgi:hypothetical protein